jgi:AmiR/NasT family two-component response regulator
MLMLLHDMSEDQAFDLLRRHSQALNIKLADVARAVIDNRGELPTHGDDQPLAAT